ncbi:MAG: hypothetical protein HY886_06985 [Deltaproteobacteria bacterium]|nr:hypothetical protein [Deltaproteobacteria bacterium]
MQKTIKIKGMGAVTSCGTGLPVLIESMRAGQSISRSGASFPVSFGSGIRVNQFDPDRYIRDEALADAVISASIDEALLEAELKRGSSWLTDAALIVGASGMLYDAEIIYRREKNGASAPTPVAVRGAGRMATDIANRLGIKGPVLTVTTACTSSANALMLAGEMIRRGEINKALVVGVEVLSAFTLSGFYSLMLLNPDGCRPFDSARRGVQLGEAAAALLLEADFAIDGGATLCGWANSCDTANVISTNIDGVFIAKVMEDALSSAGITAREIVCVKAHGTGSADNDATEVRAMRLLFGNDPPPYTGLKGYIGHTLGAGGAVETAALFKAVAAGFIPATLGFKDMDPALGSAPLTAPIEAEHGHYMANFFGFGGNNTSIVFRHGKV